jgi:imidazolonepropionase-like amidohydrolase
MRFFLYVLVLLGVSVPAPAQTLVFNHVTVVNVKSGTVLPDRAVNVSGTRIVKIGPASKFSSNAKVTVVDSTGKFLMPGLWDMHVHMFNNGSQRPANLWYLPFFVANGVTGIREMWTNPEQVAQINAWRRDVANGKLIGPHIGAAGTLVDSTPDIWKTAPLVENEAEARAFVRMEKVSGLDFVKVYTTMTREAYFAIADESRKQGIPFAGHVPFAIGAEEASAAGQRSFEHFFMISESCSSREQEWLKMVKMTQDQRRAVLDSFDPQKCEALFKTMAKNSTWQVPTLVVERLTTSSDPEQFAPPEEMKYIPAKERAAWHQHAANRLARLSPAMVDLKQRFWETDLKRIEEMRNAGVQLMAGTDVSNDFLFPGFSLHDELELFVTAHLTPAEALRTATLNPAVFLNKTADFGSVEVGKIADLVLLDENPLNDIRNTRKIRAVVLNGRYLNRTALDTILQQAEAAAKN